MTPEGFCQYDAAPKFGSVDNGIALLETLRVWIVGALTLVAAVAAAGHAILYKRDPRAAVGWVGLIVLVPVAGAVLYVLFGINRVRRRAAERRRAAGPRVSGAVPVVTGTGEILDTVLDDPTGHLAALGHLVDGVTRRPLTAGNAVTPLVDGDEAFPAMLGAIEAASASIALSTYIFDNDRVGRIFADALERARRRGVEVRILVDGVGARYSWPPIHRVLRRRGLRVAPYNPTWVLWRAPFLNLRNHRKILVVDGRVGFTGGINIREGHLLQERPRRPVQDLHFLLDGPVVGQLMETFADDWAYTTGEFLDGSRWFPDLDRPGGTPARAIVDGPDEDFDKLRWTIQGALAAARRSIRILTPYFLPDPSLIAALNVAAMRGVQVEIVLPERNNHPIVHWAAQALLWQLVGHECRVCYSPPPFDHGKLFLVDGAWALVGSANWDPRSLRLNFELNVETYDPAFVHRLEEIFCRKRERARRVALDELDGRPLPVKLRDGVASLFSPYL